MHHIPYDMFAVELMRVIMVASHIRLHPMDAMGDQRMLWPHETIRWVSGCLRVCLDGAQGEACISVWTFAELISRLFEQRLVSPDERTIVSNAALGGELEDAVLPHEDRIVPECGLPHPMVHEDDQTPLRTMSHIDYARLLVQCDVVIEDHISRRGARHDGPNRFVG